MLSLSVSCLRNAAMDFKAHFVLIFDFYTPGFNAETILVSCYSWLHEIVRILQLLWKFSRLELLWKYTGFIVCRILQLLLKSGFSC